GTSRSRVSNPRFWRPVLCRLSYAPRFETTKCRRDHALLLVADQTGEVFGIEMPWEGAYEMSSVVTRRPRRKVGWTAWGASVVVLLLSGALIESTASYGGRRGVPKSHAIAVALAWYNNSWMLSAFPRQEGRVACRIPVGGPPSPQPRSVPG